MRRFFLSFMALSSPAGDKHGVEALRSSDAGASTAGKNGPIGGTIIPRSNATHLVWRQDSSSSNQWKRSEEGSALYTIQPMQEAKKDCLNFLQQNIMGFDLPFQETMGFPRGNTEADTDGLGNGLIVPTIELALKAKRDYSWTDALTKDIFFEYVLNYANLNEARTNWRPLLVDALKFNESDLWINGDANLTSVVMWVNQHLWTKLARSPDKPIIFKSSQTPLIFDTMSIIAFGYASCTGTSILFSNALRAVGIPARVAGTPAWYGDRAQGNHNWVEVYDVEAGGEWKFLEPSPANAGLDTLDNDPCMRWFCDTSRYPSSRVYAARLRKPDGSEPATYFPLAWEWENQDVPAEDRTQYYADICNACSQDTEQG